MKSKTQFTKAEAKAIKLLLIEKVRAGLNSAKQKAVRDKIRDLEFYIEEFAEEKGFLSRDFDDLVFRGSIVIID